MSVAAAAAAAGLERDRESESESEHAASRHSKNSERAGRWARSTDTQDEVEEGSSLFKVAGD